MESQPSYYELLNLTSDASPEEIRRAYHEAARQLHPDVSTKPGSTELFIKVQKAYEVLSDPKARAKYDKNLPKPDEIEERVSANEIRVSGEAINLRVTYSRSNLPKLEESQLVYVLLDLIAPEDLDPKASPPINLCLVIDRSTSMNGERMDTVKVTAIELLRHLRPQDTLAVITFSDRSDVVIPAARGYRRTEAEGKIRSIRTGGGTELSYGLEAGLFEVRQFLSNKQVNHVILLTDGRTYGDEEKCIDLADKMASHGVSLSILGIGDEWNDQFLDGLAKRTGGSSFYVSRPGDIAEFLEDRFRGLSQVYAEQLLLKLEPSNGVLLQYVLRSQPDTLPLPAESLIRLGSMPNDNGIRLLLEFVVAPITVRGQRQKLANCTLTMDIPTKNKINYKVQFKLQRPISQVFQPEGPPNAVIQTVSQMTLYRMQERINLEMIEGNIMDANEIMKHLATQLLARGKRDLASTVLKEAERLKHTQQISEQGKKEIKYGTRALLLPIDLLKDT